MTNEELLSMRSVENYVQDIQSVPAAVTQLCISYLMTHDSVVCGHSEKLGWFIEVRKTPVSSLTMLWTEEFHGWKDLGNRNQEIEHDKIVSENLPKLRAVLRKIRKERGVDIAVYFWDDSFQHGDFRFEGEYVEFNLSSFEEDLPRLMDYLDELYPVQLDGPSEDTP